MLLAYEVRRLRFNSPPLLHHGPRPVRPAGGPAGAWVQFKKAHGPLHAEGLEQKAEPEEPVRAIPALTSGDFGHRAAAPAPAHGDVTARRGRFHRPAD